MNAAKLAKALRFGAALSVIVAIASPRAVFASPKAEARARGLQRRAIEEDNLNVAYAEAIGKLKAALAVCKGDACTKRLRAELLRDLGAMYALGGSKEDGRTYFGQALALDATLTLNPEYSTPALEKLWSEAHKPSEPSTDSPAPEGISEPKPSAPRDASAIEPAAPPEPAPIRRKGFWLGLWGSLDLPLMPSANQACLLGPSAAPVNTVGYFCTDAQGNDFPLRNDGGAQNGQIDPNPSNGDAVSRGVVAGDLRLGASFEAALGENVLLGVRAGIVLRSYPGRAAQEYGHGVAAPIHVEARATYAIGSQALSKPLAPIVFLGGGVAETDGALPVPVLLDDAGGGVTVHAKAWAVGGPGFADIGAGLQALPTPSVSLTFAAKFSATFGGGPPMAVVAPELSAAYGF